MTESTNPDNARNPEQKKIIQNFLDRGEDPFSRENIESIGNKVIAENEFWYCIPNKWPLENSKNHLVIICKRPIQHLSEIFPTEALGLLSIQQRIISKYNLLSGAWCMRYGDSKISGATCTRLHGHIICPEEEKMVSFNIGKFKK